MTIPAPDQGTPPAPDEPGPPVPPVVPGWGWACCHCGTTGLTGDGDTCPYCDGTGHTH